jgi:hypothetical protein
MFVSYIFNGIRDRVPRVASFIELKRIIHCSRIASLPVQLQSKFHMLRNHQDMFAEIDKCLSGEPALRLSELQRRLGCPTSKLSLVQMTIASIQLSGGEENSKCNK